MNLKYFLILFFLINLCHAQQPQKIIDWSFVTSHAAYAGALSFDAYETAHNVGSCAFESNSDLGSVPSDKKLIVHSLVEFGAVFAGDYFFKWASRHNKTPHWLASSNGSLGAIVGVVKHTNGGLNWRRICH